MDWGLSGILDLQMGGKRSIDPVGGGHVIEPWREPDRPVRSHL